MTDFLGNLALGFSVAFSFNTLFLCLIGCLVGTLVGVLPGVGPIATIAMLLPLTFGFDPVGALIMLAGIYYGAQYGGSTTAILSTFPGKRRAVVTTLDGHQMARKGRAGSGAWRSRPSALSSQARSPPCSSPRLEAADRLGAEFGPAEYFSLMVMGLDLRGRAGARLHSEGHRDDPDRSPAVDRRAPISPPGSSA